MAYSPIAFVNPQYYTSYATYWLKGYQQGTTTPLSMATAPDGLTLIVRAEITAAGFIKTSGGALFTPHFNQAYDLWLFPTAADADANTTANAIQVADNLWLDQSVIAAAGSSVKDHATVAAMIADTSLIIGDYVLTAGYVTAGDGGDNLYQIVAGGTGTDDGGSYIDLANGLQAKGLFPQAIYSVKQFGAYGDGSTDDTVTIQAAIDYLSGIGGGTLRLSTADYKIDTAIAMKSNVTVLCDDGVVIDGEGSTVDLITFTGTVGSEYTLAATAERDDVTISVSGSPGFAAGDIIHMNSKNSVFDSVAYRLGWHPSDNCYFSEFNIIAEDLGSGVYRLANPIEFPGWDILSTVKKVTPIENSHWKGGIIRRTTTGDTHFETNWCYKCTVSDCKTEHGSLDGRSVQFVSSWKCEARNIVDDNDPEFLFSYDVDHGDINRFKTVGTQDCGFVGIRCQYAGQPVDFTYSSSSAPYSNVRSYCRDSYFYRCYEGLTSHPGSYKESWINNNILQCMDDGIVIRGYMAYASGNRIESTVDITDEADMTRTAGAFVIGRVYKITTVGTTDFTLIGSSDNNVNTVFTATGVGSGTGTATESQTYAIKLQYGGARRADISDNYITGFYGAFAVQGGSPSTGDFNNVLSVIHNNEISHCYYGLVTVGLDTEYGNGELDAPRFITYKGNHHSFIGKGVVEFGEYTSGSVIQGNVMDGGFRYDGAGDVSFFNAADNCPANTITQNIWNRAKGSNSGNTKTFATIGNIADTTTYPAANWAAQTVLSGNYVAFDVIDSVTMLTITNTAYIQNAFNIDEYTYTIASGAVSAVPSECRSWAVVVDTEGAAATDDLDKIQATTNAGWKTGDIITVLPASSTHDVTIRDVATSGAVSDGFQLAGGTSIAMTTTNHCASFVHNGTHWIEITRQVTA